VRTCCSFKGAPAPEDRVHDYEWKRNQALGFLRDGSKVKATVFFRGREREHPEESRTMTAVFAPR
jgi:translation initiation factor IF-3